MVICLMDALRGKYQYAPPEATDEKTGTSVPKKRKRIKMSAIEAHIHWSDEMEKHFEGLKSALDAATGLYLPKSGRPWRIRCDASDCTIGGALEQEQEDGGYHLVAFFSRKLQGQRAGQGGRTEAGEDPDGHLLITWGVYLCAGKPPSADFMLYHPPDLT